MIQERSRMKSSANRHNGLRACSQPWPDAGPASCDLRDRFRATANMTREPAPLRCRAFAGALALVASTLALAVDPPRTGNVEVYGHYSNGIGSSDAASAGYITP